MSVGGDGPGQRDPVGAGLFLGDSPGPRLAALQGGIPIDEFWPLDASLDFKNPAIPVQAQNPIELPNVNEAGIGAKLLASHGVSSACDRNRASFLGGGSNYALYLLDKSWFHDARYASWIEL